MDTATIENIKGYCRYYDRWYENANGLGYCKFTACTKGFAATLHVLTTTEMGK